jgi:hypothetical protein
VLPIGGVKQKVLAAHRAGLTEVILPARNEGDLDDVPDAVREQMTFHLASDVRQVLEWALEPPAGGGTRRLTSSGTHRCPHSPQRSIMARSFCVDDPGWRGHLRARTSAARPAALSHRPMSPVLRCNGGDATRRILT